MKYTTGIFAGSFNPLHIGHLKCIEEASAICKKLFIILSVGYKDNEINYLIRYRWLYQATAKLKNIEIFILHAKNQKDDTAYVKSYVESKIDVVFCGNDYGENSIWHNCYPDSQIHIFDRNEISSTTIRNNPFKYWDWLPNEVRPYYVKKVLIVGSISTGKTTLTKKLAQYFSTNYIEEAGRELSKLSGSHTLMLPEDYTQILLTHKLNEMKATLSSNKILFLDTDSLTTLFYMNLLKNADVNKELLAKAITANNNFDLVLFLEPDIEFVQDGDRNSTIEKERIKYSEMLKSYYTTNYNNIVYINGNYNDRLTKAIDAISTIIKNGN